MESTTTTSTATVVRYFRNGKTMSAYARKRYGSSKFIWDNTELWWKTGNWSVAFNETEADKLFGKEEDEKSLEDLEFEEMNRSERHMEEMMDYRAAGMMDSYYSDRDAGYAY